MEWVSGNIFIRDNNGLHDKGWRMEGGPHNFSHTTYFIRGIHRVWAKHLILNKDGTPSLNKDDQNQFIFTRGSEGIVKDAGTWVLIEKGVWHDFECLEGPGLFHCIYSHRDPQGEVVQEYNGWQDAYV